MYRESQTPSIPHRSPFRIRDSQLAKMQQSHIDRWSFSSELGNMWNMKPILETYTKEHQHHNNNNVSMFSSGNLLTQLLVSQAILDSNDFKILSFEKLDSLKKEYSELHEHIKNLSKSIELENRIKNISKSLENINLKNSRNSVIYLQNQRQRNDYKIKKLTSQVEQLKLKEIDMKKTILKHTAAVLSKGIQDIESSSHPPTSYSPLTMTPTQHHYNDRALFFESELNNISNRIDRLYQKYCSFSNTQPKKSLEKLLALDQHLSKIKSPSIKKKSANTVKIEKDKAKLLAIEREKKSLLLKLVDMDSKSTKLLKQLSTYSSKQRAMKFEMLQFKGESIELKLWDIKRQRDEESKRMNTQHDPAPPQGTAQTNNAYEKKLRDQAKLFEDNIHRQNEALEEATSSLDRLQVDCSKFKSVKAGLDNNIREKSKMLDERDNKISFLNEQIRNQARALTPKNDIYRPENKEEKARLKKLFTEKEERWTEHTHGAEDSFDELLENFDKLTNTAIEFDSTRMKYDRTINQLTKDIQTLEGELIDEKVKKIGYNNQGEAPTTAALRKEFRLLVAEIKKTHQARMDREGEEIKKLQMQLEELQNSNNNKHLVRQHSMAVQTD